MSIVLSILKHYRLNGVCEMEYLGGAGGFSGAQIWKILTADDSYCLRRWPASHPDSERLDWINLVLVHVSTQGCPVVATPLMTLAGGRYVRQSGFLWELAPWMTGQASFHQDPNDAKLENAMQCLAQFHLASAQVNLDFRISETAIARHGMLTTADRLLSQIRQTAIPSHLPSVRQLLTRVVEQGGNNTAEMATQLRPFVTQVLPVQPVIRDVWHDHLLFTGNQVTGMVDFGAMQIDNVAVDLARLAGSLIGAQDQRWQQAISTYSKYRALSSAEIQFAKALNRCSNFLSGLNWLKWILVERREFESWDNVEHRIGHLAECFSKPDLLGPAPEAS